VDDDTLEGLRDRYRGTLIGSAVGDALGATVEFMSRADIQGRFGVHREITGGGWLHLPAGEVTDDTQMARCLARSLVERAAFDGDDIAAKFVEWYRSDPPDIGNTTVHAIMQLASGTHWTEAGQRTHEALRPRDASNGSIMRAAPVALFARGNREQLATFSIDQSRITHANPLCLDSCVALNVAIAALLDDPSADPIAVALESTSNEQVNAAIQAASSASAETLDASGYVLATLQSSFWALVNHESFEDVVVAAVNLGDDADTTGAVAGALAGARWGYAAIPERWRTVLIGHDELIELADGLLEMSIRNSPPAG
jgi:ADP-ribosyl-[dinitrogen reductase] hydrolase